MQSTTKNFQSTRFALPIKVHEAITGLVLTQELSSTQSTNLKVRLINMARYVLRKYLQDNVPFNEVIEISRTHFARNLNSRNYAKDLQILKDGEIIHCNESYMVGKDGKPGFCKAYWFTPDLIYCDTAILAHDMKYKTKFGTGEIEKQTVVLLSKLKLSIKTKEIKKTVGEIVNYDFVASRLLVNESIPNKAHEVSSKGFFMSKDRIISHAKENGLDAILYKNNGKIYFENRDTFIKNKVFELRFCYIENLLNISQLRNRAKINCKRNTTNQRLDTNLTNLPSLLFSLLQLDGEELTQYDLSNSQFVIMANLISATLEDEEDNVFHDFMKDNQPHIFELAKLTTERVMKEMDNNVNDLFLFINETRNGIYYECLANHNWDELYGQSYPEHESLFDLESKIHFHKYRFQRTLNPLMKDIKYQMMDEPTHKKIAAKLEKQYKAIRGQAKQIMFENAFSSHTKNSDSKDRLRAAYPSLVLWIDTYKRVSVDYFKELQKNDSKAYNELVSTRKKKQPTQLGSANLAVSLQRIESQIFIDYILEMLLDYGFRVFSKHDSIVCKESKGKPVKTIVTGLLDLIFGNGNYRLGKG